MAISYTFKTTQIHLFELNVLPDLLVSPGKTIKNPDFLFLANKKAYMVRQKTDDAVITDHFVFQRFPKNISRSSSLWRRYIETHVNNQTYFWDLQIPFSLRLRKQQLEVLAVPEKERANVKAESYLLLNSIGWSTHINLVVNIPLKPSNLADLCSNLRDKAYGPPSYRFNGVDMTLKGIFLYYRKLLMTDILSPDAKFARPDHIPHLIFVDVIKASGGKAVPFYNLPVPLIQVLASIVRRNNVSVKMEYQDDLTFPIVKNMMITEIDPEFYNFSLTDFDQGSFTFMQIESLDDGKSNFPFCYARNTHDAFLVSYLWLEYYRRLSEKAKSKPVVSKLIKSGSNSLKELRSNYTSRTSLRLLQKHKGLVDFLSLDESEDEE